MPPPGENPGSPTGLFKRMAKTVPFEGLLRPHCSNGDIVIIGLESLTKLFFLKIFLKDFIPFWGY